MHQRSTAPRARRPPLRTKKSPRFLAWAPDSDVCGEAAAIAYGNRLIELISTRCADGSYAWEIVEGCTSLGFGRVDGNETARRAAETAARRALLTVA